MSVLSQNLSFMVFSFLLCGFSLHIASHTGQGQLSPLQFCLFLQYQTQDKKIQESRPTVSINWQLKEQWSLTSFILSIISVLKNANVIFNSLNLFCFSIPANFFMHIFFSPKAMFINMVKMCAMFSSQCCLSPFPLSTLFKFYSICEDKIL